MSPREALRSVWQAVWPDRRRHRPVLSDPEAQQRIQAHQQRISQKLQALEAEVRIHER